LYLYRFGYLEANYYYTLYFRFGDPGFLENIYHFLHKILENGDFSENMLIGVEGVKVLQ